MVHPDHDGIRRIHHLKLRSCPRYALSSLPLLLISEELIRSFAVRRTSRNARRHSALPYFLAFSTALGWPVLVAEGVERAVRGAMRTELGSRV